MRRFMLALGGLVLGLLLVANVASAHILGFDINDTAVLQSPSQVTVSGHIQCTAGETYTIRVNLAQNDSFGRGAHRGTCSGDVQPWQVQVQLTSGPGFTTGPATACANAGTRQPGTTHRDAVRHCETVQIV